MTRIRNRNPKRCELCNQNPKQEFETLRDQSSTAKMAKDDNNSRKGSDKPRRRGNHKQNGNRNQFRGPASKQSKAVLKLEPAPEPTKTTSVKILDEMENEVKEKLPNFRDDDKGALLVELCKKAIGVCQTYELYNEAGDWKAVAQAQHRAMYGECKEAWSDLVDDVRNWGANGANKHKTMCQKICQSELGERVFLDQRAAMRAGLSYQGHDHERAVKRLYTLNNLMEYLAENATKFSPEEMCRDIIPACLKPRARVEYVKNGGEDLVAKGDVIALIRTISRGIECEIDVQGARKRAPKEKSKHDSSSESDDDRDDRSGGRRGGDKTHGNMCRIPGHNHAWKDCPNNRWSENYKGPSSRSRSSDNDSRSRSRSSPRSGARHRDRDRGGNRDRDRDRDRDRHSHRDRHGRSGRRRGEVSSLESMRSDDESSLGSNLVRFDNARDSIGSHMDSDQSSLYSNSTVSRGQVF